MGKVDHLVFSALPRIINVSLIIINITCQFWKFYVQWLPRYKKGESNDDIYGRNNMALGPRDDPPLLSDGHTYRQKWRGHRRLAWLWIKSPYIVRHMLTRA